MAETLFIEVVDRAGGQGAPAGSPQRGPTVPEQPQARRTVGPRQPSAGTQAGIEAGGAVARQAASGDVAGAAASGIRAAAGSLGAVGTAAIGVTAALGAAVVGVVAFTRTMSSQVQQLAGFSGQLSVALAESQVALQQSQIRRARRLEDDLAGFEELRSQFEVAFSEVGTNVLEALLTLFNVFEPLLVKIAEFIELNAMATQLILEKIKEFLGMQDDDKDEDTKLDALTQAFVDAWLQKSFAADFAAGEVQGPPQPAGGI